MEFIGVLFALIYAVVLTLIFSLIFRNTGPWSGFWVFFFLIFLVALGAGEWTGPVGPAAWGYYWTPGLLAAVIFALALAATVPTSRSSRSGNSSARNKDKDEKKEKEITAASYYSTQAPPKGKDIYTGDEPEATLAIGAFFWMLMVLLLIVAVAGILR